MTTADAPRYLLNAEINRQKWDECVGNSAQHLPYAHSWFLDIAAENWDALVLGDYDYVMPLPFKKKLRQQFIYQPFFTQQLGVFGKEKIEADNFLSAIPDKFKHIHTNLNYLNSSSRKVALQKNLVLEITEDAQKKYSTNCTRNISKAKKNGLEIKDIGVAELIHIFRSTRGADIRHLKDRNYKTLYQLCEAFLSRKLATSKGIYTSGNELLGGAVIIEYRNRLIFFFSALTPKGKEMAAMHYFIDRAISSSVGKTFDFEGSNNEGLYRFYSGFGATDQNYSSYSRNHLAWPLSALKK